MTTGLGLYSAWSVVATNQYYLQVSYVCLVSGVRSGGLLTFKLLEVFFDDVGMQTVEPWNSSISHSWISAGSIGAYILTKTAPWNEMSAF